MGKLTIRASRKEDIDLIMSMYDNSRREMRAGGNHSQWVGGYPSLATVEDDILKGHGFIIEDNGIAIGTFAFIVGRDHTYEKIFYGQWDEDDRPYGTIHRMARASGARGVFKACVDWCRQMIPSLRIDTHADNATMIHLIEKHGFKYKGIILIDDGTERKAYQMVDCGKLCIPLIKYLEDSIIPQYQYFDQAHREDHVRSVINNSLDLASHYPVEINMVYATAAYHDLGLVEGRELHHLVSGQIMRDDKMLRTWFNEKQITTMSEAVEDHRASRREPPRSLYGRIVAEADRDIEPLKIIRRTIQYGINNHPGLDKEGQWSRTLEHLNEKYADGGYLKLWLPESKNTKPLNELRALINDKEKLRVIFDEMFDDTVAKTKGEKR